VDLIGKFKDFRESLMMLLLSLLGDVRIVALKRERYLNREIESLRDVWLICRSKYKGEIKRLRNLGRKWIEKREKEMNVFKDSYKN